MIVQNGYGAQAVQTRLISQQNPKPTEKYLLLSMCQNIRISSTNPTPYNIKSITPRRYEISLVLKAIQTSAKFVIFWRCSVPE